jgi:hypothetical protein
MSVVKQNLSLCGRNGRADSELRIVPRQSLTVCGVAKVEPFWFVLAYKPLCIGPRGDGHGLERVPVLKITTLRHQNASHVLFYGHGRNNDETARAVL